MFCFFLHIWEDRHDSALLGAIVHHNLPAAHQAFQDGATMQMEIRRHSTFLQAAAYQGDVSMAKLLVEHGAAETVWAADDDGKTAYDIALASGHTEMADYLRSLMKPKPNNAKNAP